MEQMKGHSECSKQFVGIANVNGHCWCMKAGGNCGVNIDHILRNSGYLFQLSLPSCNVDNTDQGYGTNCTCSTGFKGSIAWAGDTASGDCSEGELKTRSLKHALTHL